MRCPRCEVIDLVPTDRQAVEIDYCPACRGVWLDKQELDKIIDRSLSAATTGVSTATSPPPVQEAPRQRQRDWDDDDDDRDGRRRRRGSWLGELFDFD